MTDVTQEPEQPKQGPGPEQKGELPQPQPQPTPQPTPDQQPTPASGDQSSLGVCAECFPYGPPEGALTVGCEHS